MNLTREEALKYHRQMWTDMQKALGETGTGEYDCRYADDKLAYARNSFKLDWCEEHFPNVVILSNCFLCEYAWQKQVECTWQTGEEACRCIHCPIKWHKWNIDFACECNDEGAVRWNSSPISQIIALPERSCE